MLFHITNPELFTAGIVLVVLLLFFITPARRKIRYVVTHGRLRSQNPLAGRGNSYVT